MKMMFVHKSAEAKIVIEPATLDQSPLQGTDAAIVRPEWSKQPVPKWGKTVNFKPIREQGGMEINGETYRGHVYIEDPELYAHLRLHPRYGLRFIALDLESGQEMLPEDAFFVSKGDGSFKCVACEKELGNAQGLAGHRAAKSHGENVNDYLNTLRFKLRGY